MNILLGGESGAGLSAGPPSAILTGHGAERGRGGPPARTLTRGRAAPRRGRPRSPGSRPPPWPRGARSDPRRARDPPPPPARRRCRPPGPARLGSLRLRSAPLLPFPSPLLLHHLLLLPPLPEDLTGAAPGKRPRSVTRGLGLAQLSAARPAPPPPSSPPSIPRAAPPPRPRATGRGRRRRVALRDVTAARAVPRSSARPPSLRARAPDAAALFPPPAPRVPAGTAEPPPPGGAAPRLGPGWGSPAV